MSAGDIKAPDKTCPSARAAPGATLLGIRGPDGRIANMRTPLPVTETFLDAAGDAPETRMRFASKCETSGCAQWTGTRCGVIDNVLEHLEAAKVPVRDTLPPCPIRGTCRWHAQTGVRACYACELVTTDTRAIAAE